MARPYYVVREDSAFALQQRAESELAHLEQHVQRGSADGVTLSELDASQAVHAHLLYVRNRADFPSTPATEPEEYTLDEFTSLMTAARAFGAQRSGFLALTVVRTHGESEASTEFTVVDRAHRRRGPATAVKAHSILTLAAEGVRRFTTGGAAVNEGSLRANQRLGYVLEPLWLTLRKQTGR